jgi:hypothetical protein
MFFDRNRAYGQVAQERTGPAKKGSAVSGKIQRERFIDAARETGLDETKEALEKAFAKLVPPRQPSSTGRS